jgi:hypothetical protein
MQVCEKESCTPYSLVKKTVLDHIWAYPLEKASSAEGEDIKPDLGEVDITDTPESEPSMEAEAVSERVRKILEGKEE